MGRVIPENEQHIYNHYDPPLDQVSLGFDTSAKGEVQPHVKITCSETSVARLLLKDSIAILKEQGTILKAVVREINA
jgi:hypothetical protein